MNRTVRLALLLVWVSSVILACQVQAAEVIIFPRESTWKWEASGTDLGTTWRDTAYVDTAWAQGVGILGYGESYIDTPLPYGPDPNNKYRTTYFRKEFTLPVDVSEITTFFIRANFDDGIALYLNGTEILQGSMPGGPFDYNTFAVSHEGGSYETADRSDRVDLLKNGTNLIAVEVHQTSPGSSDLVWDLETFYTDGNPGVTRGPYLQVATDTSITVRWRTDAPTTSGVRYGSSPGSLNSVVTDANSTTEHEIQLGGLPPLTKYFYSVGTVDTALAGDSTYSFTTSPVAGTNKPTRIWFIGDSGRGNANAEAVRDGFHNYNNDEMPDLWVMLGDNAYNTGTDAQYQVGVFDMYPKILRGAPLWTTRGNHDQLHSGINNDYYDIFTMPTQGEAGGVVSGVEAYYSFDYGPIHFICLDSQGSDVIPPSVMLDWLALDLAATNQNWIIAFWHHPPYSQGSHNSDNLDGTELRLVEMRENVVPILEAAGVDMVLGGHSHDYERSYLLDSHYGFSGDLADSNKIDDGDGRPDGDGAYMKPTFGKSPHEGSIYVVAGNGSQTSGGPLSHPVMIESQNILGSFIVDIDGNQLDAVHINTSGAPTDSFTIVKGGPIAVGRGPTRSSLSLTTGAPNPFRSQTRIAFELSSGGPVELSIYDAAGRRIRSLHKGFMAAGRHVAIWEGMDENGMSVSPGMYFSVLRSAGEMRTRKILLVD